MAHPERVYSPVADTCCTFAVQQVIDCDKSFSAATGPSSSWAWPTSTYCLDGSNENLQKPSWFTRRALEIVR